MTPMQIIDFAAAFMVVVACVFVSVCSLAIAVGCIRSSLSKK